MSEEYKTAKELFDYFKKKGLSEVDGVVVAVPWGTSEESYVFGIGKIKPKDYGEELKGISINSKDKEYIELIKGEDKKRTNYFELPSAHILYFEEKTDADTIEKARKILEAEIAKDRKGKRS